MHEQSLACDMVANYNDSTLTYNSEVVACARHYLFGYGAAKLSFCVPLHEKMSVSTVMPETHQ